MTLLKPYLGDDKNVECKGREGLTHSPLSNSPTSVPLPSHNECTFILQVLLATAIRQLGKRRMRLHEHRCIEGNFEKLAQLLHTLVF